MQENRKNGDPLRRPARSRLRAFWALGVLTALDIVRQPIVLVLTLTSLVATTLVPVVHLHGFGEEGKLARDGGLAFHLSFGGFLAAYSAASVLRREVRCGTAAGILSKPVSRDLFFLAKLAGLLGVLLAFSVAATIATLLAERVAERFVETPTWAGYLRDDATAVRFLGALTAALLVAAALNYARRRPFLSVAYPAVVVAALATAVVSALFDRWGRWAPFDFRVELRLLPAAALVTLALVVLASAALAFSTRLDPGVTILLCAALLGLGLAVDGLAERLAGAGGLGTWLLALVPNGQHFWRCDALDGGGRISWGYVARVAAYAAAWAGAAACAGIASFREVEIR